MSNTNLTVSGGNWTADRVLQPQTVPRDRTTEDIDQGVDRPHLMKMDLIDRTTMDFGRSFAERVPSTRSTIGSISRKPRWT
jgi:hypothetical protein